MTLILPSPDRFSLAGKIAPPVERADIVVIGAGAAGCAAALEAAAAGASVILVDEHPVAPGLIGLDVPYHFGGRATAAVQTPERLVEQLLSTNPPLAEALEAGVDVRLSTVCWGAWVNGPGLESLPEPVVALADETAATPVGFGALIVAAGARDLNFSFAGSDQPGVMGAQAFAALLTRYDAFAGRRVAIVGSGELGATTARLAAEQGIEVVAVVEVRDTPQADLGAPVLTGHVPLRAEGGADGVFALVVCAADDASATRTIPCDTVVLAVGAVPMIELFDVLGASRTLAQTRGGHVPLVGPDGATSVPRVFAAGDCTGLGGDAAASGRAAARAALASLGRAAIPSVAAAERGEIGAVGGPGTAGELGLADAAAAERAETIARVSGRLPGSGLAAAAADAAASEERAKVAADAAAAVLGATSDALAYQLDWADALLTTGGTDVPICLCEEVSRADLLGVQPPRYLGARGEKFGNRNIRTIAAEGPVSHDQMKRLTRVTMGACQGRRCREQVALSMAIGAGTDPAQVPLAGYRAPVRPLPLAVLASLPETPQMAADWNVWFGIVTQWIKYDDIGTEREIEQIAAGMPY